jgi:oligoribonuclease
MKNLFWVDLEMTGLDEKYDAIIEVAVVITDLNLKQLEEYHRVVYQPQSVLERMDDWCKKTHGESGLTSQIPHGTPLEQVEKDLIMIADRHFDKKQKLVLTGNSVGSDKRFIDAYMPNLAKRVHYRVVDVSSYKEIFRERYGVEVEKKNKHRALGDIHESIRELETYLAFVHVPPKKTES